MERADTGPFCEDDEFVYKTFMPKRLSIYGCVGKHSNRSFGGLGYVA